MISGRLLEAAQCNAVWPSCSNKTKKQYVHNIHYTDKFQLNVLVTHNTFIILMISCKYPLCDIVNDTIIVQLCSCIYSYYCRLNILHYKTLIKPISPNTEIIYIIQNLFHFYK